MEKIESQSFVKNSSFLSRDIENQKTSKRGKDVVSPPRGGVVSPPPAPAAGSQLARGGEREGIPPRDVTPPGVTPRDVTEPKVSPPKTVRKVSVENGSKAEIKDPKQAEKVTANNVKNTVKAEAEVKKVDVRSKVEELQTKVEAAKPPENNETDAKTKQTEVIVQPEKPPNTESARVGDKIKKFEKAAEDAGGTLGRQSRPGSVRRGRSACDELPPPPDEHKPAAPRWPRNDDVKKPEPQKIIKPEFKPLQSPIDATIRSPSLGTKISDQFPSHGTAFRNVASPDTGRADKHNDDVNTQNNVKACKFKSKEKREYPSVSKGSSYFTRGSEEIWLVKKKDIEEIEERVLDSFRRAGGNMCSMRAEPRAASDSGQGASHTLGRPANKRQVYARSESLDPQWAGGRAQTLKRQTSVACTCGHDKKPRAKSSCEANPRARSRSHGDDNNAQHVLDKYETLV